MKIHTQSTKGFSMIEIMVVLVVMGLLAFLIIPNVPAIKRKGEDSQMKAKAQQFNQAMANYMSDMSVREALVNWKSKSNDQRYSLLKDFLSYAPASLSDYLVEGYTITFPDDPRSQTGVVVTTPEGVTLQYQ